MTVRNPAFMSPWFVRVISTNEVRRARAVMGESYWQARTMSAPGATADSRLLPLADTAKQDQIGSTADVLFSWKRVLVMAIVVLYCAA